MNDELIRQAARPGSDPLRTLTDAAREDVLETLTAVLAYPAAQRLADALEGEPLQKLREAASSPLAAVEEAQQALTAERATIHDDLAAFFSAPARREAGDHERAPADTSPRVKELQEELTAAVQAATPSESAVRSLSYKIDSLRAAPRPDPVILERLGLGRNTACRPRPEKKEATS